MRRIVKRIVSLFLVPLTRWYISKERKYNFRNTRVTVLPGVFHPGLFHSTKFILGYLVEQPINGTTLLELGCGSGLISVITAKMGAHAVATDISLKAIENTIRNAADNHVNVEVIQSDLFDNVPMQTFDWIIINPPYYNGEPANESEFAWYAGDNFSYFRRIFPSLKGYTHDSSAVIMVLTKGTALDTIMDIGLTHGVTFELIRENDVLFDKKDFLFRLKISRD